MNWRQNLIDLLLAALFLASPLVLSRVSDSTPPAPAADLRASLSTSLD